MHYYRKLALSQSWKEEDCTRINRATPEAGGFTGKVGVEVACPTKETHVFPLQGVIISHLLPWSTLYKETGNSMGPVENWIQFKNKAHKLVGEPKWIGLSFRPAFLHSPGNLSCLIHISVLHHFLRIVVILPGFVFRDLQGKGSGLLWDCGSSYIWRLIPSWRPLVSP